MIYWMYSLIAFEWNLDSDKSFKPKKKNHDALYDNNNLNSKI